MATYPLPPIPLFGSYVNDNTAGAGDETLAAGVLTLAGLGQTIPLKDILGYSLTVYSAGVAEAWTAALAAATVTAGVSQKLTLTRLDNLAQKTYVVLCVTGETTTTLATKFRTAINADVAPWIAATGSTTNVIMTEVGNVGGFIATFSDSLITQGTHTAHVNSSGTAPEVQQYSPTTITGTQYSKFQFFIRKLGGEAQGQATVWNEGYVVYWVESQDAQYAAFAAALLADLNGSVITAAADVIPYVAVI